jgi:hypothetical protein
MRNALFSIGNCQIMEIKNITGNCYIECAKTVHHLPTTTIPYSATYGYCDQFDKSLAGCAYPYK